MLQPNDQPRPRREHRGNSARDEPSVAELLRAYADFLDEIGHGQTPISRQQTVFEVELPDKTGKVAFIVSMMRRT